MAGSLKLMPAHRVEEFIVDLTRAGLIAVLRSARANLEGPDAELSERALTLYREGVVTRHAVIEAWCYDKRVDRG